MFFLPVAESNGKTKIPMGTEEMYVLIVIVGGLNHNDKNLYLMVNVWVVPERKVLIPVL